LVRDHPGRLVPEETTLLDFYGAGEDNGSRDTDSPGGHHTNRINGAPTPTTPPRIFTGRMPEATENINMQHLQMAKITKLLQTTSGNGVSNPEHHKLFNLTSFVSTVTYNMQIGRLAYSLTKLMLSKHFTPHSLK